MTLLIALAAITLFAAGAVAGIIGMVTMAIRKEEKNLTLLSEAPGRVTAAGRYVNGVYVRARRRAPLDYPAGVHHPSAR